MTLKLFFQFRDSSKVWPILCNTEAAPQTCKALWDAVEKPASLLSVHAMFAGPEIMTGLPAEAQTFDPNSIPAENQTCFPGAGECLWYYQRANLMKGLPDELWEVGIFYDVGGRTFGPLGWTPCNIFGQIGEDLDGFADACRSLRLDGAKQALLGRLD